MMRLVSTLMIRPSWFSTLQHVIKWCCFINSGDESYWREVLDSVGVKGEYQDRFIKIIFELQALINEIRAKAKDN